MTDQETTTLTIHTFDSEVLEAAEPVLVDFWAPWCGPCRALAPTIDALASDLRGRVKVAKVNVDDNPELLRQYDIKSIPTLIVFKGGHVVERLGSGSKASLRAILERHAFAAGEAK
jgi:thioredoxin 1